MISVDQTPSVLSVKFKNRPTFPHKAKAIHFRGDLFLQASGGNTNNNSTVVHKILTEFVGSGIETITTSNPSFVFPRAEGSAIRTTLMSGEWAIMIEDGKKTVEIMSHEKFLSEMEIIDTTHEERDDVMRETLKHVRRVQTLLLEGVVGELQRRAINHDTSKFSKSEFDSFVQETPKLRQLTYGSEEYKKALERLGPALQHHYRVNRHHPEHFGAMGIDGMTLIDLLEMLADWKAATERHDDGDLTKSIVQNSKRFVYNTKMILLLLNTAWQLGWVTQQDVFRGIDMIREMENESTD